VIWKGKSGKQLSVAIARELIRSGHTSKAVIGFKARSGRSFRAHLALSQDEEGKWRVEFNEPWAQEGAKPPESQAESAEGQEAVAAEGQEAVAAEGQEAVAANAA
jgi:DNA topoisomerase-3